MGVCDISSSRSGITRFGSMGIISAKPLPQFYLQPDT